MPALVPYKPDFGDLEKSHADFHSEQYRQNRRSLLSKLRDLPGFIDVARSLNRETLYRVVLPEGKVLQQVSDGVFSGIVRGADGQIQQHARFTAVGPSLMGAAKQIGAQSLLINIAIQLDRIEKLVECLSSDMHRDRIAEVLSGVNQFETAMVMKDRAGRQDAIGHAVSTLHTGLQKTIAELRVLIAKAPEATDRIRDHLRFGIKTEEAAKVMGLAQECFRAALLGIKALAESYAALREPEAARKALSDYLERVRKCNIESAAKKARLLEFSGPVAPQAPWEAFLKADSRLTDDLALLAVSESRAEDATIEVEFMPAELEGDAHGEMP